MRDEEDTLGREADKGLRWSLGAESRGLIRRQQTIPKPLDSTHTQANTYCSTAQGGGALTDTRIPHHHIAYGEGVEVIPAETVLIGTASPL